MVKDPKLGKHSHNNRESREGMILRLVREFKKLSLLDVATKLNLKAASVDHFENGRKFYTENDLEIFLTFYQLDKKDFETLLNVKIINKSIINNYLMQILS